MIQILTCQNLPQEDDSELQISSNVIPYFFFRKLIYPEAFNDISQ